MVQFSRLRPLLLSALFAVSFVAEPLLPGSLHKEEKKTPAPPGGHPQPLANV